MTAFTFCAYQSAEICKTKCNTRVISYACAFHNDTSKCLRGQTNLAEFLHLFMRIWIQLLRYILHPKQRSTVFSPGLLHPIHRQPRVRDGSVAERFDLLVQTAQRVPQSQSVGCSVQLSIMVPHVRSLTFNYHKHISFRHYLIVMHLLWVPQPR